MRVSLKVGPADVPPSVLFQLPGGIRTMLQCAHVQNLKHHVDTFLSLDTLTEPAGKQSKLKCNLRPNKVHFKGVKLKGAPKIGCSCIHGGTWYNWYKLRQKAVKSQTPQAVGILPFTVARIRAVIL